MCAFLCARDLNISSSCRCCNGIVSNKTRRCFVQKKCCYVWTPPVSYCTSGCKWAWRSSFGVVVILNTTVNIEIMAFLSAMELPNLFREIGVCQQALSFIQTEPEIKDNPQAAQLRVARGRIEFERLSFAYQAQPVLFKEISLVLQAGQKTGLVGLSGGGKSTFVHLILRHYDLQSGRILIDGQDIRH